MGHTDDEERYVARKEREELASRFGEEIFAVKTQTCSERPLKRLKELTFRLALTDHDCMSWGACEHEEELRKQSDAEALSLYQEVKNA